MMGERGRRETGRGHAGAGPRQRNHTITKPCSPATRTLAVAWTRTTLTPRRLLHCTHTRKMPCTRTTRHNTDAGRLGNGQRGQAAATLTARQMQGSGTPSERCASRRCRGTETTRRTGPRPMCRTHTTGRNGWTTRRSGTGGRKTTRQNQSKKINHIKNQPQLKKL